MAKDKDPFLHPTPPADKPAGAAGAAPPTKLCLIIVFNHRFDENLPKLDWIYRDRFEHVRYLVPFYRGDRPDVFPVYYSSFQFEGYFMEAWRRLHGEGFTHFLFCADDMILNPALTGENFCAQLGLDADTGYIRQLVSLGTERLAWFATASGLVAVAGKSGLDWEKELPSFDDAAANLEAKGYPSARLGWHNFRDGVRAKGLFQFLFYLILRLQRRRRDPATDLRGLPYPLLNGNSDIIVVPAAYLEKFSFYCSVFAAMGVFVEIGAPTALALSCPRVFCEEQTGWTLRDNWYGRHDAWEAFCRKYDCRLERFLADFGEKILCVHPIKLSQWTCPN